MVVENVLDPTFVIEPVMAEYSQVLDDIAASLVAEGAIRSTHAALPFTDRLIQICTESGRNFPKLFDIRLLDGTATAFNSQYPTTVPSLSSFASTNLWRLVFTPGGGVVQGKLTSFTLTAVPLPAAVILFGAGLISLVGLGAGGLRNLRWPQA